MRGLQQVVLASTVVAVFLLGSVEHTDALVSKVVGCGVEMLVNSVQCVMDCRQEHHCTKIESFCKKIKVRLLRKLCNALLKCACPTCLKCVAKCTIRKFFDDNVCHIGKYLRQLLKVLNIYNYFNLEEKADQEEAMEEVLKKVVNPKSDDLEAISLEDSGITDVDEDISIEEGNM